MSASETTALGDRRDGGAWTIDPARTVVEFGAKTLLFKTVTGRFTDVSGEIMLNEKDPAASSVAVTIGAASITTGHRRRDTHLRSADFLDVATVPAISFKSTGIETVSSDHLRVTGDLTIRTTTRPVVLDARIGMRRRDERGQMGVHVMAQGTINRYDFDLSHSSPVMVGKTVTIRLEVQGIR